jgi:hypothetical protein
MTKETQIINCCFYHVLYKGKIYPPDQNGHEKLCSENNRISGKFIFIVDPKIKNHDLHKDNIYIIS